MFYKLDEDKNPVPCELDEWVRYQATGKHCLLLAELGDEQVSTVFLGLDSTIYGSEHPRFMFETMHFPGNECERCSTYAEAELQHQQMVVRFMKDVN